MKARTGKIVFVLGILVLLINVSGAWGQADSSPVTAEKPEKGRRSLDPVGSPGSRSGLVYHHKRRHSMGSGR